MSACTFFGHRDAPDTVLAPLLHAIENLIVTEGVTAFYVGNHGAFDRHAYAALCRLRKRYPHIRIAVVLAYMPSAKDALYGEDGLFPEGIETVPKRFAIHYRNEWMLSHADCVISYTPRCFGGAMHYVNKAKRQNKKLVELQ